MMQLVRIFVNERAVEVAPGTAVEAAVAVVDAGLAEALRRGRAYVTDGVGRPIDPRAPAAAGAIFRVVRSAPRHASPPDPA
jgi:hypothetical protein